MKTKRFCSDCNLTTIFNETYLKMLFQCPNQILNNGLNLNRHHWYRMNLRPLGLIDIASGYDLVLNVANAGELWYYAQLEVQVLKMVLRVAKAVEQELLVNYLRMNFRRGHDFAPFPRHILCLWILVHEVVGKSVWVPEEYWSVPDWVGAVLKVYVLLYFLVFYVSD